MKCPRCNHEEENFIQVPSLTDKRNFKCPNCGRIIIEEKEE